MHYSTCALIQRAVTPDNVTFNQECLESSRAALMAHMRANLQFNTKGNEELWSGYIHWSILQVSQLQRQLLQSMTDKTTGTFYPVRCMSFPHGITTDTQQ